MKKIKISLDKKRSYEILIQKEILEDTGKLIRNRNIGNDIFVITDKKVGSIYLKKLIKNFKKYSFNSVSWCIIPEGERSKSFRQYEFLLNQIHKFDKNLDKNIVVICLGGGVIGDIGGFVAGTYRRGVNYVQVPTTLLSQVDSSVGGKVGINLKDGKNLVGMFYQPSLVIIDPSTLQTLEKRELKAGLAEVVKYGIIKEPPLLKLVENHLDEILSLSNQKLLEKIIYTSIRIKSKIVQQDERDQKDIRIVLNFGHTIGHAIESASKYKKYKHGEAISIGIVSAFEIAKKLKVLKDESLLERVKNILGKIGLPVRNSICKPSDILETMKYDKKFRDGKNRFVLPVKLGQVKIVEGIKNELIMEVIKNGN